MILKGDLSYWEDQAFNIEKIRVSVQVGISHLAKRNQQSPEREKLLEMVRGVEDYIDGYMAGKIVSHPTWPWASRQKGVGKENFPKVIGLIEGFGHYYDVGDPMIPAYVKREPETYYVYNPLEDETLEKCGIFVAGIERLTTSSKLWKYCGWDVEDGHAPKRRAGVKLGFNADLRMATWRLMNVLIRQVRYADDDKQTILSQGVWNKRYHAVRLELEEKALSQGRKIVPTPRERLCPTCNVEVTRKATFFCPTCGDKLLLKTEPPGYLYKAHLNNMAIRETIKDWLVCLWLVWREAEGLPVTQPYKVDKLGHKPINPWEMVDREPELISRP